MTGVVDEYEGPWFASILNIGALIGCFVAGWTIEKYGRRLSLMFLALPFIFGWLIICGSTSVAMLCFGRMLTGVGGKYLHFANLNIRSVICFHVHNVISHFRFPCFRRNGGSCGASLHC